MTKPDESAAARWRGGGRWQGALAGAVAIFIAGALAGAPAWALTPGRGWAPTDTALVTGYTRLYPDRIELDPSGGLLAFAALGGGGRGTAVLGWADSVWVVRHNLGYGVDPMHKVIATGPRLGVIWSTLGEVLLPGVGYEQHYLVMTSYDESGFSPPDTVGMVWAGGWSYAGAVAGCRRWAVDYDYPGMRAWYSDTASVWHELQAPWGSRAGDHGVTIAPLDDTTAMLVYAGGASPPLRWELLRDDVVLRGGGVPGPIADDIEYSPRLRRSPSGALWLGWSTDYPHVRLARYRGTAWDDSMKLSPSGDLLEERYWSRGLWLSRDDWELPSVMWTVFDTYSGWTGSIYVCVPSDTGYPAGEYLPGSLGGDYGDVVRDRNGDVWVVWQTEVNHGMFTTHSYTRATCSAPEVRRYRGDLLVTAKLSEPAPETWWAVERADEGKPFTEVARVRVRDSVRVGFLDKSPPRGPVRYRIRRECLDTRYQWWSGETDWPQCRLQTLLLRLREWLGRGLLAFEVEGAAPGPLEVTLYDVAGRRVLKRSAVTDADGRLDYRLDLDGAGVRVGSGVYFLSVRDARGERAAAAKIVVLR